MKNLFFTLALFSSMALFSQHTTQVEDLSDGLRKITTFYEDGTVNQIGYMKNSKLHGEWKSFAQDGSKQTVGYFENGRKQGKWFFWKKDVLKEVDFKDNKAVSVIEWNSQNALATK